MSVPAGDTSLPELTECRVLRRDGSVATVEVAPAERVTFGGASARLVIARDVTERVRMQRRLMTADRLASMGLVAAGVAHEINNPLAYVLNNIQIASRELSRDPSSKPKAGDALAVALEGVFRIRDIVHNLITLSRSEAAPLQPVDVRATLESTLALAHGELVSGVHVVRTYEACPAAEANAARIGQVFLNLITNAVDAMPKDSPANELRLSTSTDARGRAVVEVSDNGVGMAPEVLGRVFEPFFTTKGAEGTGLGLAMVYATMQRYGGTITLDTVVGRGTRFRLWFPPAPE
jgi:signal transduction histidine kinase